MRKHIGALVEGSNNLTLRHTEYSKFLQNDLADWRLVARGVHRRSANEFAGKCQNFISPVTKELHYRRFRVVTSTTFEFLKHAPTL